MKKVLFVYTANTCRSPMAQAIFDTLAEDEDHSFRVESGGTAALKSKPIAPNAIVGLEETVFYPGPHRARQMREVMIEEAEPVLFMTSQHVVTLHRFQGNTPRDVHALPEYAADVPSE